MSYIPLILCLLFDSEFKEEFIPIFIKEVPQLVLSTGLRICKHGEEIKSEMPTISMDLLEQMREIIEHEVNLANGDGVEEEEHEEIDEEEEYEEEEYEEEIEEGDATKCNVFVFSEVSSSITCQLFHAGLF